MRNIKFRAFHKKRKEMFSVIGIDFVDKRFSLEKDNGRVFPFPEFNDVEIMQYTGLNDCEGKEICEGDLVISWLRDRRPEGIYEVIFDKGSFKIKLLKSLIEKDYHYSQTSLLRFGCGKDRNVKVIGNIYENGDLLNDK